jgi:hypothetical protein
MNAFGRVPSDRVGALTVGRGIAVFAVGCVGRLLTRPRPEMRLIRSDFARCGASGARLDVGTLAQQRPVSSGHSIIDHATVTDSGKSLAANGGRL